ncbi:IS30 family transposase, partial [Streptococcus pyogenes]
QTIHNEVKRGLVRQQIRRGKFEMVYQADYAQDSYEMKRRKSVRSVGLDKDTKDKILHYMKQNFSPEMMVRTKGVAV